MFTNCITSSIGRSVNTGGHKGKMAAAQSSRRVCSKSYFKGRDQTPLAFAITHRRKHEKSYMQNRNGPRTEARKNSKLRALTPRQRQTLKLWLIRDKLTYDQARAKMVERFSVSLSSGTLNHFWNDYCRPAAPPPHNRHRPVLLDVIIQSTRPIRVRVLETKARLRFKVGTQRQRGLDKKTDFHHQSGRGQ